jgi:hypothetical protein
MRGLYEETGCSQRSKLMEMTKRKFRRRWKKPDGGGITFDDIADCAKAWGLFSQPKINDINKVTDAVLKASGTFALVMLALIIPSALVSGVLKRSIKTLGNPGKGEKDGITN